MKDFLNKYRDWIICIGFMIIYLSSFCLLEAWGSRNYIVTDMWIDQYIPFNEYFVIPYMLWFVFILSGFLYFLLIDKEGFNRTAFYLFVGMITCIILFYILPTEQCLREEIKNENIFQSMVGFIYSVDTSTNVCPSIHVYNSIMMTISLLKSKRIKENKLLCVLIGVLALSICMSTVLLKQHAFIDGVFAILLCVIIYIIGKKKFGY